MVQTLTARTLHTGSQTLHNVSLTVDDGHIQEIRSETDAAAIVSPQFEVLTPAFFDIHVHGALGHDFMLASVEEMANVGRFLALRGVAHYLPTTVTSSLDKTLQALEGLAQFLDLAPAEDCATPVGLHLEGPFLCPAKRGVHPTAYLLAPSIEAFERFQQAAGGHIKLLTLAPEMPGALELISYAVERGVRVSMGHSNATAAETEAAIRAGARSATHLFNAMHVLDHREPGIAGVVLDDDRVFAEAIVDGIHIHPAMIRLWLKMKGEDRAILVTDGMAAMGMPDGTYRLGDLVVEVRGGVCRSGGALAGSVLTMETAVSKLREMTGVSLGTAVRLASHNPAAMLGLPDSVALVMPGAVANLNLYDEHGLRCGTVLNGKRLPL